MTERSRSSGRHYMNDKRSKRARFYAAPIVVSGLLLFAGVPHADERLDAATSSCQSVDDCLNVLYDWSRTYNGRVEDVTGGSRELEAVRKPHARCAPESSHRERSSAKPIVRCIFECLARLDPARRAGACACPFRRIRVEWLQDHWVRSGRRRPCKHSPMTCAAAPKDSRITH